MKKLELTKAQLAEAFSVTTRAIELFQLEPDFPSPRREGRSNMYPLADCIAWFVEHRIGQRVGEDDGEVLDLTREKALLARAQRKRTDLQLRREAGALMPIEAAVELVMSQLMAARSQLLGLHVKLRARYPELPPEAIAEVERLVREALEELAADDAVPESLIEMMAQYERSVL